MTREELEIWQAIVIMGAASLPVDGVPRTHARDICEYAEEIIRIRRKTTERKVVDES